MLQGMLLLLVLTAVFESGSTQPRPVLYTYGPTKRDKTTPLVDDGTSGEVPLSIQFTFFGKRYKSLYVNNNGVISFNKSVSQYTPDAIPIANGDPFVAPYWGDVNNVLGGTVYYRESTDLDLLQQISADMEKHLPNMRYKALWACVATWDKVAYYGSTSQKTNTFQVVLSSDGVNYIAILNYGDIQWTTGSASGGDRNTGLGGTPAQAGFNSGDATHFFSIPGSRTNEILNIASTSNVNYPGRWVFEVDEFKVPGGCVLQVKFVVEGEEVWKEDTCKNKCTCRDGKVTCVEEACASGSTCEASGSFFICRIKEKIRF